MSRRGLKLGVLGVGALVGVALLQDVVVPLAGYPLDGYRYTGIRRLLAYQGIQDGKIAGTFKLQAGALLSQKDIRLRLAGINDAFDIVPSTGRDTQLQAGLERIVGSRDISYKAALLDITDPTAPRFAAVGENEGYIPGSVGKLLVMTGLFGELKRMHPGSVEAREAVLRNTMVTADRFVIPNSHTVPVVDEKITVVTHRSIAVGDRFTLWEWLDHMVSPSSNAAGSIVWKQALLMRRFGSAYPPSGADEEAYFQNTKSLEMSDLSIRLVEEPLEAQGLDSENLRIRTYFTRTASNIIPGKSSYSTPRELLRWLVKLEQGKLVDHWSSLEMKKLMYFTRRRYRYAASPALDKSAVFFKSGSLYRCRPEAGYQCEQYKGNAENLMHSVAIVESPSPNGGPPRIYLLSMMSNVLKVNSAQEHATIATEIERLVQSLHP